MWVVDQHVAHERTILDRLTDPAEGSAPTVQPLLIPEVVELSLSEAAEAAEYLEELAVYGFEAEPFGPTSFRISGVISTLADRNVGGAFKDALSAARGTGPGSGREDRILATIACHSSVRLGDRLSHVEMKELIRGWLTSRFPLPAPMSARSVTASARARSPASSIDTELYQNRTPLGPKAQSKTKIIRSDVDRGRIGGIFTILLRYASSGGANCPQKRSF